MKKVFGKIIGTLLVLVMFAATSYAQCAMCRGSVESSMGNGRNNVGIGLNTGIMYLFVVPYIVVGVVAYMWYRNSKKEREERMLLASRVQRALDA